MDLINSFLTIIDYTDTTQLNVYQRLLINKCNRSVYIHSNDINKNHPLIVDKINACIFYLDNFNVNPGNNIELNNLYKAYLVKIVDTNKIIKTANDVKNKKLEFVYDEFKITQVVNTYVLYILRLANMRYKDTDAFICFNKHQIAYHILTLILNNTPDTTIDKIYNKCNSHNLIFMLGEPDPYSQYKLSQPSTLYVLLEFISKTDEKVNKYDELLILTNKLNDKYNEVINILAKN